MGVQSDMMNQQVIDPDIYSNTFVFADYYHSYGNKGYKERALWSSADIPPFVDLIEDDYRFQLINLPVFMRMANVTMDDLTMSNLIIQMNDPEDHTTIDNLAAALKARCSYATVAVTYKEDD